MYNIENKEKYYIYCRKKWKEIQNWKAIKYGEKAEVIQLEEDTLECICETFSDVLRYFANYYNNHVVKDFFEQFILKAEFIFDSYSYISMCYIVDQFNRIICPSSYKYEIIKMIEKKDFEYKSNVFTKKNPWMINRKPYFIHSYEFRKDPVPGTACKRYYIENSHSTKVFTNNFEIDRDELDELNIDYYLPIQRKKESKSDYYYDWDGKRRNYSKSWKSNTKCRKQWMKHLKD